MFLEKYSAKIDDAEKNYALSVIRNACLFKNAGINAWIAWAVVSETLGNIGGYTIPETAAWIYKEACINRGNQKPNAMFSWIKFAHRHPLKDGDDAITDVYLLDYAADKMEAFNNPNWNELYEFKKSIGYTSRTTENA